MKLVYTGFHYKVTNMVGKSNQILSSVNFYHDLQNFLCQHYDNEVIKKFLKRLKSSELVITIKSNWHPFSRRLIYTDKTTIYINTARLNRASRFYVSLLLQKAFLIFDLRNDISANTLRIDNQQDKDDILQGIGHLAGASQQNM